ncbi:uncharacterized protein LOC114416977 [Glycine soja]|nr:uncharacterized protein LOC114416977 [Glycine soja]
MSFSETEPSWPDLGIIPVDFYEDLDLELVLDKSDHMWLFFLNRVDSVRVLHVNDNYIGKLLLECDDIGCVLKESYAEVKKFGYRWVYKEDIEGPSKQLSRKRKFGEIEENASRREKRCLGSLLCYGSPLL